MVDYEVIRATVMVAFTAGADDDYGLMHSLLEDGIDEADRLEAIAAAVLIGVAAVDLWRAQSGKPLTECVEEVARHRGHWDG